MSNNEQKYFVGNWIQNKKNPKKIGFIYGIFEGPVGPESAENIFYDIAFIDPGDEIGFRPQDEISENYIVISYPWQLFFKVGDKVKESGSEKIGTIDHIASKEEIEKGFRPIYVIYPGHSRHDFYNPHELIKIGE